MQLKAVPTLFKKTYEEWSEDDAPTYGAAIAYYGIFSLAPLLVIAVAVAGFVFGQQAAEGKLVQQIQGFTGPQGAQMAQAMIQRASQTGAGITATIISVIVLLVGATGVFTQLERALNAVWDTRAPAQSFKEMIWQRVLAFLLVLFVGFLLLLMLVMSAVISMASRYFVQYIPFSSYLLQFSDLFVTFVIATLLFAVIFKVLPQKKLNWSDVWVGAIITSILFAIGKFALGFYLGRGSVGSVYGAAGSLIVILLWIYYSSLILLFGAEFTQVYARESGSWKTHREELEKHPAKPEAAAAHAAPHYGGTGEPRMVTARMHHGPVTRTSTALAGLLMSAMSLSLLRRAMHRRKRHA